MVKTRNPELEQQRKALIIDTVYRLLAQGSHRRLTLDRVAREAGISKGMVTYYFASKELLIVETIDAVLGRQGQQLQALARAELPGPVRLQLLVAAVFPDREKLERDLRFQAEVLSFAKDVPEVLERVRASYVAFREACQTLIAVGREEGYVTARDAEQQYVLMHALLDGLAMQIVMDPRLDLDALRHQALALLDGMLTAGPTTPPRPG